MNGGNRDQVQIQHTSSGIARKRLRVTQACILCRKKKIKCDGTKPECLHCQEAFSTCHYTEYKKRGPRKGYIQELEERLASTERHLIELRGKEALLNDRDSKPSLPSKSSVPKAAESPIENRDDSSSSSSLPPKKELLALVDLFFRYINTIIPILHKPTFHQKIKDDTVSKPLLWGVLALGARYSDSHDNATGPRYLAGEQYAARANALIDDSMLEPTLPNIQFWSIMACLEYGRASGTKAWIYSGLATRFCQELRWNKEEILSTSILAENGTVDLVAMSLRRRVFWSCLAIDKYTSAGTNRPQALQQSGTDACLPNVHESLMLRDVSDMISATDKRITDDSLMGISEHYLEIILHFGEVNGATNRVKHDAITVAWPRVREHDALDMVLRKWKEGLPEKFQFSPENVDYHKDSSSVACFSTWLSMHAVWCSSLMVLHRGSLAYGDVWPGDVVPDMYRAIQKSIDTCKLSVRSATGVFQAMQELGGHNVLPFMGYSAYVFATVLMTSTFSKGPDACRKSGTALKILYELINSLRPYWPVCERLASTTSNLIAAHNRLYAPIHQQCLSYDLQAPLYVSPIPTIPSNHPALTPPLAPSDLVYPKEESCYDRRPLNPSRSNSQSFFQVPPGFRASTPPPSNPEDLFPSVVSKPLPNDDGPTQSIIDFDSLDFLNDSGLFGQIMLDSNWLSNCL